MSAWIGNLRRDVLALFAEAAALGKGSGHRMRFGDLNTWPPKALRSKLPPSFADLPEQQQEAVRLQHATAYAAHRAVVLAGDRIRPNRWRRAKGKFIWTTEATKKAIVSAYDRREGVALIAARYKISRDTVRRILRAAGREDGRTRRRT